MKKQHKINMIELASLIDCGAANPVAVERLLEPGNEEALQAYIIEAKRSRNAQVLRSCNSEFFEEQAAISQDFQGREIGKKVVEAICENSHGKEQARTRLKEVQQFFKDYGLTSQANEAWKNYWA